MSLRCQLLIDPPADGGWNMALDEAILESAAAGDHAVWLRFYQWREPTLSLGYFQRFAPWQENVAGKCAIVRRQTGGGAILHDRELTYSLVLPPLHPAAHGAESLYALVHGTLIAALGELGVSAELCGPLEARASDEPEPFLCFRRRSPSDVVIRTGLQPDVVRVTTDIALHRPPNFKICGSAQRRRKGAVLMHGSLLLEASDLAPQILGIKQVTGISLTPGNVCAAWSGRLIAALNLRRSENILLPNSIRAAAEELAQSKYSSPDWIRKR